ncbi:dTDP-4-dehydrorhamnose reductase family protein [Methylobacterium tardum]|nr:SDR family oxidoreductase [Methylobacterium tardum]
MATVNPASSYFARDPGFRCRSAFVSPQSVHHNGFPGKARARGEAGVARVPAAVSTIAGGLGYGVCPTLQIVGLVRVLIFGASGMLGHAMCEVLAEAGLDVYGSSRGSLSLPGGILEGIDVLDIDDLHRAFEAARPQLVVNAVGLVKQLATADDPLEAVPINTLLPHRLARLCRIVGARLVHVSTDCVFSGLRGGYTEDDAPDAVDLYGTSKRLGEVNEEGVITLRTSIIGHELRGQHGLVEWFMHAPHMVQGYTRAIFSGVTTRELARVVRDIVIPRADLSGLFHLSAAPISKYDLLRRINDAYGLGRTIEPSERVVIDRSLDSSRWRAATGYVPPSWDAMIADMRSAWERREG